MALRRSTTETTRCSTSTFGIGHRPSDINMSKVHFLIALHNHQPVGNFDVVFERACKNAYKPFLDELQRHPDIRMSIHYSGSLLERDANT